ncbi:MAG: helix-turn-helix transcriptional regulator [Microbacteriaceae bacterium]|nr:helix-turn-helix transcriptional regulator [Microbacteriaceae bacterium]
MRTDARRRRERLIAEARRLFAEQGHGVALEAVAEASEVGIATLYRNFAARDELITAVALAIIDDVELAVARCAEHADADAVTAWRELVDRLVELDLGALTDALGATGSAHAETDAAQRRAAAGLDALLARLAAGGAVRAELRAIDVVVAISILTRPQPAAVRAATPGLVERLVDGFVAWAAPAPR